MQPFDLALPWGDRHVHVVSCHFFLCDEPSPSPLLLRLRPHPSEPPIGTGLCACNSCSLAPFVSHIATVVSQARLQRLQAQLSSQGIASAPVFGELAENSKERVIPMLDHFTWALQSMIAHSHDCPSSSSSAFPSTYLLLEDDTTLHPHFARELSLTLQALPPEWQVLHLCIGFLWGRDHTPKNSTFALRPDGPLSEVSPPAKTQRFLPHWPSRSATAGSPVAMAIRDAQAAARFNS